ncbi:MAG: putative molybdenum carrier protein, partial [Candidatus Latescibacterota bacterium]
AAPARRADKTSAAVGNGVIAQIVSGGQTGVDRAALDAALECGFPCGGWCPRGRLAEDGPIPARYPVRELDAPGYPARTVRNVRDSDGTLILQRGGQDRGTGLTERTAEQEGRPLLVVDLARVSPAEAAGLVVQWVCAHQIQVLNVAGPRESSQPGIHALALAVMRRVVAACRA